MHIKLSLRQLEAFVQVAEHGSFRRAAEHCGESQPTISRLIQQAEAIVGARLFDRDTRRIEISTTGRQLLPVAQRILREVDESLGDFGEFMAGRRGRVAVAGLPSVGASLLPRTVVEFSNQFPLATFDMTEAPAHSLLNLVTGRAVDFGISVRPSRDHPVQYQHLLDDPFVLVCRRDDPLAGEESLPWSTFSQRRSLVSLQQTSIRAVTDVVFMRQPEPMQAVLEYPSVSACGALITAGMGISALPMLALRLLDMDELTFVPLRQPSMSRPIGCMTLIGRSLPPVSSAFLALLLKRRGEFQAAVRRARGSSSGDPVFTVPR